MLMVFLMVKTLPFLPRGRCSGESGIPESGLVTDTMEERGVRNFRGALPTLFLVLPGRVCDCGMPGSGEVGGSAAGRVSTGKDMTLWMCPVADWSCRGYSHIEFLLSVLPAVEVAMEVRDRDGLLRGVLKLTLLLDFKIGLVGSM